MGAWDGRGVQAKYLHMQYMLWLMPKGGLITREAAATACLHALLQLQKRPSGTVGVLGAMEWTGHGVMHLAATRHGHLLGRLGVGLETRPQRWGSKVVEGQYQWGGCPFASVGSQRG